MTVKGKQKNSWKEIQEHCKRRFGFYPALWQVRLWWFGSRKAADDEKLFHKTRVEQEFGAWDVVIRLCMDYAFETVKKTHAKSWNSEEVCRFVYHLLWSKFERSKTVRRRSDGKMINAATWWTWALERRGKYEPVIAERGLLNMRQGFRKLVDSM